MFGLDHFVASFSDGTTLLLVIGVAVVLGLRHATDPDLAHAAALVERDGPGAGAPRRRYFAAAMRASISSS